MALFKPILGNLSGSIGASTFTRNRYGSVVRNRATPVNPNTGPQNIARTSFTFVAQAWAGLTAAQRALWEDYASQTPVTNRIGDTIYLSGQAWHQKLNCFRDAAGVALKTVPPGTPGEGTTPEVDGSKVTFLQIGTVGNLVPTANWNTLGFSDHADAILAFWYSPALSAGVKFYNGPWHRFIKPSAGLIAGLALPNDAIAGTNPPAPVAVTAGEFRILLVRQMDEAGKLSPFGKSEVKTVQV